MIDDAEWEIEEHWADGVVTTTRGSGQMPPIRGAIEIRRLLRPVPMSAFKALAEGVPGEGET